jgi:hypothetical protein
MVLTDDYNGIVNVLFISVGSHMNLFRDTWHACVSEHRFNMQHELQTNADPLG